jgi:hypothetical protein
MNKVLMSLLFAAFIFTGTTFAQTPPPATTPVPAAAPAVEAPKSHHEHHPEIHKAMRKLRGAKDDLQKAAHDFGGHKAKAIAAIDEALAELHAALDYDK